MRTSSFSRRRMPAVVPGGRLVNEGDACPRPSLFDRLPTPDQQPPSRVARGRGAAARVGGGAVSVSRRGPGADADPRRLRRRQHHRRLRRLVGQRRLSVGPADAVRVVGAGEELRALRRHDDVRGRSALSEPGRVHERHHLRVGRGGDGRRRRHHHARHQRFEVLQLDGRHRHARRSNSSPIAPPWSITSPRCRPTRSSTWRCRREPSPTPTASAARSSTIRCCRCIQQVAAAKGVPDHRCRHADGVPSRALPRRRSPERHRLRAGRAGDARRSAATAARRNHRRRRIRRTGNRRRGS